MEERIQQLQSFFQKDYKEFIQSLGPISTTDTTSNEQKSKIEPKIIPKNAHPIMLNKINKYKKDLEKNNMKRQQNTFIPNGTIDDYENELGLKKV